MSGCEGNIWNVSDGCSQVCDILCDSATGSQGPSQTFVNPAVKLNLEIFIREETSPKYMSNRKEILFKGKEILLTDMTKFSLPVDVSALTHRPAVGRNTNTLKKRQWRWDLKNNTFCSLDIFKRGISYCFNAFLQFLLSFLQSFEIFHNSFIVISERKVLHDIALILFTFSLPALFFLLTLFLQGLWRWQKSSLVCRTPCEWSWWRRTYVVIIIFYCMYDLIQLD